MRNLAKLGTGTMGLMMMIACSGASPADVGAPPVAGDADAGGAPAADADVAPDADADADAGALNGADGRACPTDVTARPGTVITDRGAVTGARAGNVWSWRGIPFAAPPIGALRWQPPQPAACWQGERAASAFGPKCPQLDDGGHPVGAEDCLTLNVWAPDGAKDAPVVVFLHGGANVQGSTSDPLYDGNDLAMRTGAVIVTVEYRLGALGFFAHGGLDAESPNHVSGNYGILDQIAALEWVRSNVAGFGGSPSRVLLFGESAGGQDTLVHLASPRSKDLFSAAAVESGGVYKTTLAEGEIAMQNLVDGVGCAAAADVVACMRGKTPEALLAVPAAAGPLTKGMRYVPLVDGYVLPGNAYDVISHGQHNAVPLILGTNADETSRMVPDVKTEGEYEAFLDAEYGSAAASAIVALYPASSYPTPRRALVQATTDLTWTCPIRRLARAAAAHQSAPVFRYRFTWHAPGAPGAIVGAAHGIELPFVFHTFATFPGFTPSASDESLSSAMQGYWSRLASGDVNGASAAVAWPRYDVASDPYLELDATIAAKAGLATANCDAIDALAP